MAARRKSKPARRRRRSNSGATFWGLLLVALLIAGVYLWQQGTIQRWLAQAGIDAPDIDLPVVIVPPGQAPAPPAPPTGSSGSGDMQVYFTTPSLVYPDVPRNRVPPPFETALIADIDAATQSVELVTFEYNLRAIAEALVRARQRGVNVRLALDRETVASPPIARWAGIVEDAGIPISWQNSEDFMHSKFVIVDKRLVWTGSWNATINDTYRNNNNLLRITIPGIVANYSAEFEQMFARAFGNDKQSLTPNPVVNTASATIETYFSPQDRAVGRIVERIDGAVEQVRFLAFSYTSEPIAEAMISRLESGIAVSGVMESRNAGGTGAKFETLRDNGVEVLEDGNCYTMHHKVIIIDDRTVITGSYNFSRSAEEYNDENFLIIDDPAIARQYIEEFERVFAQAQDPTRCER